MSRIIKRTAVGFSTCPSMHDHGAARMTFTYNTDHPLVFRVSTNLVYQEESGEVVDGGKLAYDVYRESVYFWLVEAPGGSMITLGDVSLKVRLSMPYVVTFKFPQVMTPNGEVVSPMFMTNREPFLRFLADTYAALPAEVECDYLKIDDCIAQILERGLK